MPSILGGLYTTEGAILFRMHDSFESGIQRPDNISVDGKFYDLCEPPAFV